ncbi:MAG TPA: hypothetical protein VHA37_09660 [Candidatus Saccharimonadales bacterium]|nr:hypothetical protein [Candidatus Saccharimonadales bacterium]
MESTDPQTEQGQQAGQTVVPTKGNATPPAPAGPPTPPPAPAATSKSLAATPSPAAVPDDDPDAITWTASEFIAHAKSFGWYAALAAAALAFAAVVFLISRDFISVGVVIVAALLLGIYAGHQPQQVQYRLDGGGLTIGKRRLGYDQFRSFSVVPEGAFSSIVFMPLKRFAVPTTIYYAPEDEERIVDLLSNILPVDQRGHDAVDRLMHRIRY